MGANRLLFSTFADFLKKLKSEYKIKKIVNHYNPVSIYLPQMIANHRFFSILSRLKK